ncbi:GspE/PulE family protein [Thiohalophilus sp.]|uniref:GspE/PulE family protein n=1 Tax=Thiohalophilus sp. TaxID=3028392 RepID=UPI002ACEC501|nr:GspE/PulE family protein [Thiohalophilus sp.]MDZ7663641.1 GspE/PulE family protein [Thiohalophilus sp.]
MQQPKVGTGDRHLGLHELIHDLVEDGRLDKKTSDEFLIPARTGRLEIHPLVIISQQEWDDLARPGKKLTLEVLTQWLAERAGLPYFRIDPLKVDVTAVTAVTSSAYAGKHRILPVKVDKNKVVIATAEPDIRSWEDELAHITGLQIERVIANPLDIARYLNEFYSVSHSIRRATSDKDAGHIPGITNLEQLVELGKTGNLDANDKDVVQIVDWLLQYAFDQRASDIHMEPRREKGHIRFRIDGVMHQVYDMPTPVMTAVSSRIKVLGRMDVVEKRRPQDGRIKTLLPEGGEIELRLSTMPTAFGEKLVLRIFNPDVLVKDFTALGFSAKDITGWNQMVNQPNGIILVTGPTGSGKTTTLYSTLKQLAQPEVNVCTVEDPIEMVEPAFNQMQVQHNIGLDFASGVRTLLRQDPDIIMVGEIRDKETAEMAIQAALTGHLVLSTLHTNDSSSAVTRLREIGVPAYLINATLLGVLAQRLVRTLCPHCKQPAEVDPDLWQALTRPWKLSGEPKFYGPVGCDECRNTGYMGRIGLYEMLRMTSPIRSQLGPDSDATEIRRIAVNEGMIQLRISGAQKVAQGLTTMEEVLNVVPPDSEI